MMREAKVRGAARSRTIRFNTLLVGLVPVFEMAAATLPQIQEYMPENIYKWIAMVAVIGNIVLRFQTTRPLEER